MIFSRTVYSGMISQTWAQVTNEPSTLLLIFGFNTTANIRYLQLFDQNGLPANGDYPLVDIKVNANASLSFEPFLSDTNGGLRFNNGISVVISTTPFILTLSGSADLEYGSQYGVYTP